MVLVVIAVHLVFRSNQTGAGGLVSHSQRSFGLRELRFFTQARFGFHVVTAQWWISESSLRGYTD